MEVRHSLLISTSEGGQISIPGYTIRGASAFTVRDGSDITLTIVPDSDYQFNSLKINNVDVTSKVVNNQYTIRNFNQNVEVSVTFEAIKYYSLLISTSEGGSVTIPGYTVSSTTRFKASEGFDIPLSFVPNTGYRFSRLIINNVDVTSSVSNNQYTISNISSNTTVSVTFEAIPPTTYTLSITSSSGGYVTFSGNKISGRTQSYAIEEGTSAILTFTPNSGYRLSYMKVNGTDVTSSISNNQYTISSINKNATVEVMFEAIPRYTLSITSSGIGYAVLTSYTINNTTKTISFEEGTSVTMTFTPSSGYQIGCLLVNDVDVTSNISNNKYTIGSISSNTTVSVTFEAIPSTTYTLSINSSGSGSVTYNDNTISGTTESYTVNDGTSVTLTITPNSGYRIGSLIVNNVNVTSSIRNNQYNISNINQNTTVRVAFEAIPPTTYNLSITSSGRGYVTYSGYNINGTTSTYSVEEGISPVLTFTQNSGYRLGSVKVNGVDVTSNISNNQYTISNINKNTTVEVAFEAITYSLTIISLGNGMVYCGEEEFYNTSKILTYNEGASAKLTISPVNGYRVKLLSVNGTDVTSGIVDNQYTINDINKDTKVNVVFEAIPPTTYSLSISSSGNGVVTYSGYTINGTTRTYDVNVGSSAVLTFTPTNGYRIGCLKVNGVEVTSDIVDNRYTIDTISENTTVSVTFEVIPMHLLTITSSGYGFVAYSFNIINGNTKSYTVNDGEPVTLKLYPTEGYRVELLEVNGVDVTSSVSDDIYTISNVDCNTTVKVSFEKIPVTPTYSLTITTLSNGKVYCDGEEVQNTTQTFNKGTSVELLFQPNEGYRLRQLTLDGTDVTSNVVDNKYTISDISKDINVNVVFESIPPMTYTLSITSSGNGTVGYSDYSITEGTKSYYVDEGTSALLTITPNSGFRVGSLKVNGADITPYMSNNKYTISNIQQNISVSVTFEAIPPTTYTLSITSTGDGIVRYSGNTINNTTQSYTVNEGTSTFLTFTPNSGFRIKSVSVNGVDVTSNITDNQFTISNITQNTSIEVTFEPITHLLTITSMSNGKVCYGEEVVHNDAKSFKVKEGSLIELAFQPDNGYQVQLLNVNGTDVTSDMVDNKYTILNFSNNTTVYVTFEKIPVAPTAYTLSITSSANGSVTYNGYTIDGTTKSFTVNEGTSATLTFTPNSNYQIGSVKVDGVDVTSSVSNNQYTISNISKNTTVSVTFEVKPGTLLSYEGVYYSVLSGADKTVNVANGEYEQTLEVPASIIVNGVSWSVKGIENNATESIGRLAAVIWNPTVKFNVSVSNPNFLLYVTSADYAPSTIKNVIVNGTANSITLTEDDKGNDFYCPQAFTAKTISYNHDYIMVTGVGECRGWETIALPFDVQKITHAEKGQIIPFAAWYSGETCRPFWLYELTNNGWKEAGTIKANTPYIISMPNNELYHEASCLNGRVTFSAENVTVRASSNNTPSYNGKTFVPNFSTRESNSHIYALNVNNDWTTYNGNLAEGSHFVQNLRTVHPFEAYMIVTGNNARALFGIFDDDATEVRGIKILLNQRKGTYNLNGQKLDEDNNRKLPAGVYIIDGQKVMVK